MQSLILFYDTETTGLPDYKNPSEGPQQPHIVELAAQLVDPETLLVETFCAIVRPDGWQIPDDIAAIHGITQERALADGIPEHEVVARFLEMHSRATLRVAHSESFDARILRIAMTRFGDGRADSASMSQADKDAIANEYKAKPAYCTCNSAKGIMKLPATVAMKRTGKGSWYKAPSLAEAHQYFLKHPLQDAHRALADVEACARIYFAMNPPRGASDVAQQSDIAA